MYVFFKLCTIVVSMLELRISNRGGVMSAAAAAAFVISETTSHSQPLCLKLSYEPPLWEFFWKKKCLPLHEF